MTRSRLLNVEQLEDRSLMSVFGVPWADAPNLTMSFAPDGTHVNDSASTLFQSLSGVAAQPTWQREILRAFQTWAVNADINIGLVNDGGQALGSSGAIQGDSRFGDIRVAAQSMMTHLAINTPFSTLGGTRSGDMILNSNVMFGIGESIMTYDLFSVALSEAGNTFGLSDSADPLSPLYGYYNGVRTGLTAGDIALLQDMYGAREADGYEGLAGNNTLATAKALSFSSSTSRVTADITTLQDIDAYRFQTPDETTQFTVWLETAGRSLLTGRLSVYNSSGVLVSSVTSTGPLQGNLSLTITNASEDENYYVTVESGTSDVFGIGAYRLVTKLGSGAPAAETTSTRILDDGHSNDVLASATNLERKRFQTDRRFDYGLQAKIRDASDVDFYRLDAPVPVAGQTNSMIVMVWNLATSNLVSQVKIYNAAGNLVTGEVLVNDQGNYVIQVRNAAPDARYYVSVAGADPLSNSTGNYFLGIDFRPEAVNLNLAASGTLSQADVENWHTLNNLEGQVFHFVLKASANASVQTALRMTIYDLMGNAVFTMLSKNGEAVSANVYLAAGDFTIRMEAGAQGGVPLPALDYEFFANRLTDPIDPLPIDPTLDPAGLNPTFTLITYDDAYYLNLSLSDPYSNPWIGL